MRVSSPTNELARTTLIVPSMARGAGRPVKFLQNRRSGPDSLKREPGN